MITQGWLQGWDNACSEKMVSICNLICYILEESRLRFLILWSLIWVPLILENWYWLFCDNHFFLRSNFQLKPGRFFGGYRFSKVISFVVSRNHFPAEVVIIFVPPKIVSNDFFMKIISKKLFSWQNHLERKHCLEKIISKKQRIIF